MNWQKQLDEPLFPELLWSRPERKSAAGKLLIIGGNAHEFAAVQAAYQTVMAAQVGECKIALPKSLQKSVGPLPDCEFLAATTTGSFARTALPELTAFAEWAEAVLLPGDISRNSETATMLTQLLMTSSKPTVLTRDTIEQLIHDQSVLNRPQTTLVLSLSQLQRLAQSLHSPISFRFQDNTAELVRKLHDWGSKYQAFWLVQHENWIHAAVGDEIVSTQLDTTPESWRLAVASTASVHWLQNPTKPLAALATAAHEFRIKQ